MAWSERQQALLRAMGLRVWTRPDAPQAVAGPPEARAAVAVATGAQHAAEPPSPTSPLPPREPAPAAEAAAPHAAPHAAARHAPRVSAAATPSRAGPPPSPRPDVNGLGWQALRETVAACRACGLCEGRTQTVFGTGHPLAHWLVVGEAPGADEDAAGLPFVGASGQLLDRMLAALGLTRDEDGDTPPSSRVYIANTVKCRPPRNRNPGTHEMAQCEPYLLRQIELLQPRIILALGRFAVQALLRSDEPIGKLRGRVHHYGGVPLVVSYHPAYLLRSLPEKAKAWDDLCFAAEVAARASVSSSAAASPAR